MFFWFRAFAALPLVAASFLLVAGVALAQTSQGLTPFLDPSDQVLSTEVSTFYQKPNLAKVPTILAAWAVSESAKRNDGIPPMVGFVTGLAMKHPDRIASMFPPTLSPKARLVVVTGVRIAGLRDRAEALARGYGWSAEQVTDAGRGAILKDVRISSGNDLDILWGASFATGDPQYAKRILEFYASVADGGVIETDDLVSTVKAIRSSDMREVPALRTKYGDQKIVTLVFAATALWGLSANTGPHPFVRKLVDSYVAANPSTPAARGLVALR